MANLLALFELEEIVGRRWHRLVGGASSCPRFPQAAAELAEVKGALAVFFRGLGGPAGITVMGAQAETSRHRLALRLQLGLGEERVTRPRRDGTSLYLPPRLDVFPERALNTRLYFWLAAFFAYHPARLPEPEADPLRQDLVFLRDAHRTTAAVLHANPGLAGLHAELCAGLRSLRPVRSLPRDEAGVEQAVLALLGGAGESGPFWPTVTGAGEIAAPRSSRRYRPFLPVPLWGETIDAPAAGRTADEAGQGADGGTADASDDHARRATRRPNEQAERNDPLLLNRFEKILTLVESLNINRTVDDDDEEAARKALEDADEIGLSSHTRKASTRLKFDLDLPPPAVDATPIVAELTYPEWDYRSGAYLPDHCRVIVGTAPQTGETWQPDADTRRRIHQVRRQFEAFRPRPETLRAQVDGVELDIEALVRARTDLAASGVGSDRIHLSTRRQGQDLSVALLADVSLSTDSWIDNRRVLDIEKEALLVLAHGLAAAGGDHGIFTFTSRHRHWIRFDTIKEFDASLDQAAIRRVAALKPGFYTRIGAAIRHAVVRLNQRPYRRRLLIVLTDGKPNDIDHYEGRYGIEDTRRAVQEARRAGVAVFGVTIDRAAQDYVGTLFGRGGYAIVGNPARLPAALPAIYRQLVAA
jgi:nitric oxide reductase NorD protein